MSTKEQVKTAAAKRFKTKEVEIADGAKVVLRELSKVDYAALMKRLFQTDPAGELKVEGESYLCREGVHAVEEWVAAAMEPKYTVGELLEPCWPESLKAELRREAMSLNGITLKDAAGNS